MYRAYTAVNDAETMVDGRPPIGPEGHSGSVLWGVTTGDSLVFGKSLEQEPDKLGKILNIIDTLSVDEEGYVLTTYGVEGEHWAWNEDHTMREQRREEYPVEEPIEKFGLGMVFKAWEPPKPLNVNDDPGYYDYAEKVATYSIDYSDKLMGVKLPSHDIYWDELDKMQKKIYNDIITGKISVDEFDSYVENWMASGGEQITKEANEWFAASQ